MPPRTSARNLFDPEVIALAAHYRNDPEALLAIFQSLQTTSFCDFGQSAARPDEVGVEAFCGGV